jgi:hypothetical protein
LFARGTHVPPAVQEFAWRVIETHCNHGAHERSQRSFWAYDARARAVDGGTAYAINIVSDVGWKRRSEPPAYIDMTIVDDGRLRLAALTSTFVVCSR